MVACIYVVQSAIPLESAIRNPPSAITLAYAFSPRVEQAAPDTVVLDIAGLDHLFGPPREIAGGIARRAAEMGLEANVSVAGNPDAAVHAARGFPGITIIPPGEEARVLGNLPLGFLSPTPEMEETLKLWGLRCFRDLAALPETGIAERLGPEGVRLQKLARGAGDRPLFPAIPAPGFERSMELEYPVTLLEPLSFILASLLNQLCASLEARALATNELRLRLKLQNAAGTAPAEYEHILRLPFPMRDSRAFLKLLQLDLEAHPPPAPIAAVSLGAAAVKPRVTQNGLFLPPAPEPEKLELTLARIAGLVGADNVGSPELINTHRPGAFRIAGCGLRAPTAPRPAGAGPGQAADYKSWKSQVRHRKHALAFRAFRPPYPAEVKTKNGRPAHVAAHGIRGRVLEAAGPWRTSGDWWTPNAWARDEWDVRMRIAECGMRNEDSPALYRIYRDLITGEWFVEGCYD